MSVTAPGFTSRVPNESIHLDSSLEDGQWRGSLSLGAVYHANTAFHGVLCTKMKSLLAVQTSASSRKNSEEVKPPDLRLWKALPSVKPSPEEDECCTCALLARWPRASNRLCALQQAVTMHPKGSTAASSAIACSGQAVSRKVQKNNAVMGSTLTDSTFRFDVGH